MSGGRWWMATMGCGSQRKWLETLTELWQLPFPGMWGGRAADTCPVRLAPTCKADLGTGACGSCPLLSHLHKINTSFPARLSASPLASRAAAISQSPGNNKSLATKSIQEMRAVCKSRSDLPALSPACVTNRYSICVILITPNDPVLRQPFIKHLCEQNGL